MLSLDCRPKSLDNFIGQKHIVGENAPLRKMLKNKSLIHMFFYGPPGCGKTTLSRIIASESGMEYLEFNATSLKIDSIRNAVAGYQNALVKPLIFIDEIHRLNKTQQEVLLPIMENFHAIIIGACTQNPYFALTSAIRSRSMMFEFHKLSNSELGEILDSALKSRTISEDSREYLINYSSGDARAMLNLLQVAGDDLSVENLAQIKPINEGVSDDSVHYDLISALIKSIRGSDENASVYYLARLVNAGENPEFIARRLVILASEDIGNANPNALNIATSTMLSVAKIGYPESRIILSQCVIYLASSPKSNAAYNAINKAQDYLKEHRDESVCENIKHFKVNYKYPHDFGGWVEQNYMPNAQKFVEWSGVGFEKTLREWLVKIRRENINGENLKSENPSGENANSKNANENPNGENSRQNNKSENPK